LALTALYHPVNNTYSLTIYSTFVPSEGFGPPYLMRFDGKFEVKGSGVADDKAYGQFQSGIGPGTWQGSHHDRRRTKCPPVDTGGQRLDMDVYAHKNVDPENANVTMVLEGRGIQIVSSAMQVTAPDGQVFSAPFYTDIFSPGVDFVNEFRFVYDGNTPPLPGVYNFVLLDVFGKPIPGTETQDTWTMCRDEGPSNVTAIQNTGIYSPTISWDGVTLLPGEFDPANNLGNGNFGFYQISVHPNDPGISYGSGGIMSIFHVIPWYPFTPGTWGVPDGWDFGVSLSELSNGQEYNVRVMAFYQPNPAWGGFGLECDVNDSSFNLRMVKEGTSLTFTLWPPPPEP